MMTHPLNLVLGAAGPTSIQKFFSTMTTDVFSYLLTAVIFALSWAAFLYMFSGENERRLQNAKYWLYASMVGLAVGVLGPSIGALINSAAGGLGH
jgi:hypothetical protein